MQVLAVNYANPFTDPIAVENIEHATDALGVDLVRFQSPGDIHLKTFRNNVQAWFKHPHGGMIPIICITCKTMWQEFIRIARANDVRCVVSGSYPLENSAFKRELLGLSRNNPIETTFIRTLPSLVIQFVQNYRYLHQTCLPTRIRGYLFGDPYCIGSRLIGATLSRIDLFTNIHWREAEIYNRIKTETDWDYPRRFVSKWRFDCAVGHLKDYMYIWSIGKTECDDMYAKMIRQGLLTWDEALKQLERENHIHHDEIAGVFTRAGVDGDPDADRVRGPVRLHPRPARNHWVERSSVPKHQSASRSSARPVFLPVAPQGSRRSGVLC